MQVRFLSLRPFSLVDWEIRIMVDRLVYTEQVKVRFFHLLPIFMPLPIYPAACALASNRSRVSGAGMWPPFLTVTKANQV